jgi:hypothetical protein
LPTKKGDFSKFSSSKKLLPKVSISGEKKENLCLKMHVLPYRCAIAGGTPVDEVAP